MASITSLEAALSTIAYSSFANSAQRDRIRDALSKALVRLDTLGCQTAGQKVAFTYEVVELILINIEDITDVIATTQVCRSWRTIFEQSKLFYDRLHWGGLAARSSRWDRGFGPGANDLWFFETQLANGTMYVLRSQTLEVYVWEPTSAKRRLLVLNHKSVLARYVGGREIGEIEWYDEQGGLVCGKWQLDEKSILQAYVKTFFLTHREPAPKWFKRKASIVSAGPLRWLRSEDRKTIVFLRDLHHHKRRRVVGDASVTV